MCVLLPAGARLNSRRLPLLGGSLRRDRSREQGGESFLREGGVGSGRKPEGVRMADVATDLAMGRKVGE
jgi:hypothetical protein